MAGGPGHAGYLDRVSIDQAIADAYHTTTEPLIKDRFLRRVNTTCAHYGTLLYLGAPHATEGTPPLHNVAWATLCPTIGILTVVFSFSLLGEAVRNALDPRGRV